MKATIFQIVNAYYALETISTTTLEVADIVAVLVARKALRPHVEEYEAFVNDARERLKPANYEELVEIEQRLNDATDEEKRAHSIGVFNYNKAIDDALMTAFTENIDVADAVLPIETAAKIAKMKEWTIEQMNVLSILM